MQLSIRLATRPHPGVWPRVLVTIVIVVIVAAAGWAWYGPSGVIAVLAASGALAHLAPHQACVQGARGRE
jgi:polyferredoxin